jgi:hypothetical protein
VESTGSFELELGKAIEKLRSHQTESPYHYVNRLLRAGYRSGAPRVEVKSDGLRTRVEFAGAAMAPERLPRILEDLFHSFGSSSNELAGAANLAFGLPRCQVEIRLDDGQSAAVLVRGVTGKTEVYRVQSSGWAQTSFQLTRSSKQVLSSFGTTSAEYLAVVRRFRLAPYQISINNESPPRSQAWGRRRKKGVDAHEFVRLKGSLFSLGDKLCKHHHVAELRLCDPDPSRNGIGLRPSTASSNLTLGTGPQRGGLQCCRLAFGLRADASLDSVASWVSCGDTLQVFPVKLPLPGVEIAIDASDLKLDATQERLVQDEAFSARWGEAKREFSHFASALRAAYPSQSASGLNTQAHFDKAASWTTLYLDRTAQGRQTLPGEAAAEEHLR